MILLLSKTDLVGTTLTINDKEAKKKISEQNEKQTNKQIQSTTEWNLSLGVILECQCIWLAVSLDFRLRVS